MRSAHQNDDMELRLGGSVPAYFGAILGLYQGYIGVILGLYWGYFSVILGLYWSITSSEYETASAACDNMSSCLVYSAS